MVRGVAAVPRGATTKRCGKDDSAKQFFQNHDTTFYSYTASGAMQSRAYNGGSENFFYDNIQGVVKRYNNVNGNIIGEWRYRYSASGEREQKREHLTQGVNAPKRWQYYLQGLGGEQLAVYEGHEVEQPTCGYFATPSTPQLFISASEYNVFGMGDVHNITARPIDPLKSWNEYAITDHLGSTRVIVDEGGATVYQADYQPFGEVLWQSAPVPRKGWIDKEKDAENGLGDFGVRKYDDGIGRFTSIDALWEKYRSLTPYHYAANNPIVLLDPTGLSTNTAEDGTVIAVYDDGNLGVYKHNVDAGFVGPLRPSDGKKMGETNEWNEFVIPEGDRVGEVEGKINFGSSWEPLIESKHEEAMGYLGGLLSIALESVPGGDMDIKSQQKDGPYEGRLLEGKYASARSAGNYLAALNAQQGSLFGDRVSKRVFDNLAGALHHGHSPKNPRVFIDVYYHNVTYGKEIPYAQRWMDRGWKKGESKDGK